jgi:hypothetical protein
MQSAKFITINSKDNRVLSYIISAYYLSPLKYLEEKREANIRA